MDNDKLGAVGAVVIILVLLLVFGGGMFGDPDDGDTTTGGGIGDPCASDEDCAEGLICVDGICQDAFCGPGGTCPPRNGQSVTAAQSTRAALAAVSPWFARAAGPAIGRGNRAAGHRQLLAFFPAAGLE